MKFRCPNCGRWMDDDTDMLVISKDRIDIDDKYEEAILEDTGLQINVWRCPWCGSVTLEIKTSWYDGIVKYFERRDLIKIGPKIYVVGKSRGFTNIGGGNT